MTCPAFSHPNRRRPTSRTPNRETTHPPSDHSTTGRPGRVRPPTPPHLAHRVSTIICRGMPASRFRPTRRPGTISASGKPPTACPSRTATTTLNRRSLPALPPRRRPVRTRARAGRRENKTTGNSRTGPRNRKRARPPTPPETPNPPAPERTARYSRPRLFAAVHAVPHEGDRRAGFRWQPARGRAPRRRSHPMTRRLPRGHAIRAAMPTDAAPANSASSHRQRD